jgi:hypothetical protein
VGLLALGGGASLRFGLRRLGLAFWTGVSMRRSKGSHLIVVNGVEYRWRATGNDGWISVGIWPANGIGAFIHGSFRYHERQNIVGEPSFEDVQSQIIITNRLTRRIIEFAVTKFGYDANLKAGQLELGALDDVIQWDDAVRGTKF